MRILRMAWAVVGLALLLLPSVGLLSGCGGEKVEVGETIDTDPRKNVDVMKRTEEFYRQKAQQQQGRR